MQTFIILHGWQSSKEKWQEVARYLEAMAGGLRVLAPDIPGFKPETKLEKPWDLNNYINWFEEFLKQNKVEEPFFLLGHSFGGRMAIKFAVRYPDRLKGLVLVSAAGIKNDAVSKKVLAKGARVMKKLKIEDAPLIGGIWQFFRGAFYRYVLRKTDYLKTSGALRQTISNVLDEDLTDFLSNIATPTYIIWGEKDRITPIEHGELMKEKIKDSRIEVLKDIGHAPHLENPQLLAGRVKSFLW